MPMASDELRARWGGAGGEKAVAHLEARGYTLDLAWNWHHPEPDWEPSQEDWDAMNFMSDEWDYGIYIWEDTQ